MARSTNLNVQITGDARGLQKAGRDAGGVLDKLGKQTTMTARVTERGFHGMGVAAKGMVAGVTAAAAGFTFLGKKAVDTASDISESLSKNKVLFGDHAKGIEAWSKNTATSMGISRAAALEATGTFGNLFVALDIAPKKAAGMSTSLVKLAADMASFNNASPEEALEAIRSGLVGETEPLRKFGVNMNDATLRAQALRMGLIKSTKESLDPQTKALAANALIMKQTEKAHGDFGRTSGGLANQTRILKARLSDLAANLGDALLPAAQGAVEWVNRLFDDVKSGKGVIGGFLNSLGDLPGKIVDQFNKIKDDPRGPGAAIGAMVVAGIDSIDWGALGEKVSKGFNAALKIGGKVGSAIVDAFQQVPWGKVGDAIGKGVEGALNFADTLPEKISTGLGAAVSQVNGRQVLGKLVDILGEAIDALFTPSFWAEHWKGIFATVTLAIPFAKILKIPGAATLFKFISKPVLDAIAFLGKAMLSLLGKAASEAGVSFLAGLERFAPRTARLMLRVVTAAGGALKALPGRLVGIAADAVEAVAKKLGSAAGTIAARILEWSVAGVKALARVGVRLVTEAGKTGKAIALGIIGGLGSLGHLLVDKITDAVGWAKDKVAGIAKGIGKALNPFGDGIGKPSSSLPAFGGGLMGARSSLAPFAGAASRFGLRVSSGRRPGSITSSGNVSYHSSGEAIDVAGSPAGMLGFFRQMKSKFGSRLAELIYTPGGAGVKDGRPYTYGGQVAADHFDHVHVALDTGVPGVGDGLGKFGATSYGPPWGGIQGTGVTRTGVNLKDAPHMYGVAVDPDVIPLGTRLKINPNPFNYSGTFVAFDTGGAIKGKRIDFYDWRGRAAQNGWGRRSVSVSTVDGGGTSHGGKGAPGKGKGGTTVTGGRAGYDPESIYNVEGPSEESVAAQGFLDARRNPSPIKGQGGRPLKGFRLGEEPPAPADVPAPPSASDFLDAQVAMAALTPGTEDDIAAAQSVLEFAQGQYMTALAGMDPRVGGGDPREVARTAQALKQAQDTVKALTENTDATAKLAEALKGVQDELKRQTDFAQSVQATETFQLKKYLADVLSGQIGGQIVGRAFTPGSAVAHAY